jgi:hypothetical protein
MSNPNDATLDTFFTIMGPPASGSHPASDVDSLMSNVFCPNGVYKGKKIPSVGITEHGPAFKGADDVRTLFTQLFTTFPDMTWIQLDKTLRMYSTDGNTIGVQMNVTGTHSAPWFQAAHASPPLSQLTSGTLNGFGDPGLAGVAVFTFDDKKKVRQLAIYIDRYGLMQRIAPDNWTVAGQAAASSIGAASYSGKRVTITIE